MQIKMESYEARVKAAGEEQNLEKGQFEALVSVFGNVDTSGDVVMPGAFSKSLARWEERDDPIPVIWAHQHADAFANVGHVVQAEETDEGLKVRGQLDLENPTGNQVYRMLKGRRVTQFSFAYDVIDGEKAERDGRNVHELRELNLYEVGPCTIGMNQETGLTAAKAREIASKGLDADRETLRAAYDALGTLLSDEETTEPDEEGSDEEEDDEDAESGQEPATAADDDPVGKSAAQPRRDPAQVLASVTVHRLKGHSDVAGSTA